MAMLTRVVLLLAVCAPSVLAQSSSRISLELGSVTVWLGMDKSVAKQQLEAAGLFFNDTFTRGTARASDSHNDYKLRFESGKLVYADREWFRGESTALPSVIDALAALADKGATNCKIMHDPISAPGSKLNRIFIDCGQRGILFAYGPIDDDGKSYTAEWVQERIGTYLTH